MSRDTVSAYIDRLTGEGEEHSSTTIFLYEIHGFFLMTLVVENRELTIYGMYVTESIVWPNAKMKSNGAWCAKKIIYFSKNISAASTGVRIKTKCFILVQLRFGRT